MYSTLLCLVTLGAALWLWRDSLRAREQAGRVSQQACHLERVQFLDDTVSLVAVRPMLERGRPVLQRIYQFEFSRLGDDRHLGTVSLIGARVDTLYLSPPTQTSDALRRPTAGLRDLTSRRHH